MAQWLKALATFPEDPGLNPNPYTGSQPYVTQELVLGQASKTTEKPVSNIHKGKKKKRCYEIQCQLCQCASPDSLDNFYAQAVPGEGQDSGCVYPGTRSRRHQFLFLGCPKSHNPALPERDPHPGCALHFALTGACPLRSSKSQVAQRLLSTNPSDGCQPSSVSMATATNPRPEREGAG